MKCGTFALLAVDGKGRIQVPATLRNEIGIGREVLAERYEQGLLIRPLPTIVDPIAFLSSINLKTKKSPLELKKEADRMLGDRHVVR